MPVRSRGSLLAGTAALAGLIAAGLGCQSSPIDHDSFSMPKTPPQASSSFLSRRGDVALPAGYPIQPIAESAPAASSFPVATPVLLQSAPTVLAPANNREVIASTWSPVRRLSTEHLTPVPDLRGSTTTVIANPQAMVATKYGQNAPTYVLSPGERVYVDSNHLIKPSTIWTKLYSSIQRTFGVPLQGAGTVIPIQGGNSGLGLGETSIGR